RDWENGGAGCMARPAATQACELPAALRHDCDFDVARQPDNALERAAAQALMPALRKTPTHENLRGLMVMRKLHDALRHVVGFNYLCPDAQIARETQMFLDRLALFLREIPERGIRADINRETFGAEIIGHSSPAADQHRCRRPFIDANQDAFLSPL